MRNTKRSKRAAPGASKRARPRVCGRPHANARAVLESAFRDQRRFGHALHDSLCQELAAISFACEALRQRTNQDTESLRNISDAIAKALAHAKRIVRQMDPVSDRPDGLVHSLKHLGHELQQEWDVHCQFAGDESIRVHDPIIATNLFRIAEHLIDHAVQRSRARHLRIGLSIEGEILSLCISHDARSPDAHRNCSKDGKAEDNIILHRTRAIGATLSTCKNRAGRYTLKCTVTNVTGDGKRLADIEEHHA